MSNLKEIIKYFLLCVRNQKKYFKYSIRKKNSPKEVQLAELIRNIHSIEKGLSLSNPRKMFGKSKIENIINIIEHLNKDNLNDSEYLEVRKMAIDVLKEYLIFNNNINDEFLKKIKHLIEKNDINSEEKYGGTLEIQRKDLKFDEVEIEKFIKTRHSIRDFDSKPVDIKTLNKAIELAKYAPSACNRQGFGIYVVDKNNKSKIANWLSGVGGFAESVDKFIIITGKTSSYNLSEHEQYIVSASIYVAYLSLTLHLYGLGACICQRTVTWNKNWDNLRKKLRISEDEQIICVVCVGNLKDTCKVPISHRLNTKKDYLIK